jgi:4-hydroxy-4-methyl-2-oxoglutarate aldolase
MDQHMNPAVNFNVDDVSERFAVIYTGAIADVLDEMGYRHQVLPSSIQGLTMDHHVTGIAMPVEGQRAENLDPDETYMSVVEMLGDLGPGDVVVCQPNDSLCSHTGELSCETAKLRGARGVVVDGGARDIDYILKLQFPVFCRYRTPLDVGGRWKIVSHGEPVKMGQVTVRRGDFIVGDMDGVLVIPQEITLDVLKKAEEVVGTENLVRKAILQGVHPVDAYRKYGRF